MHDGLPILREGKSVTPQITAKAWNTLVSTVRRQRVMPGPNTLMNQDVGGTQHWEKRRYDRPVYSIPATFFTYATMVHYQVAITLGAINSIPFTPTNTTLQRSEFTVADGDTQWIKNTIDSDGVTITATEVVNLSSDPSNTSTLSYWLLARVAVNGTGGVKVTPLGWNFVGASACGIDGGGLPIFNYW